MERMVKDGVKEQAEVDRWVEGPFVDGPGSEIWSQGRHSIAKNSPTLRPPPGGDRNIETALGHVLELGLTSTRELEGKQEGSFSTTLLDFYIFGSAYKILTHAFSLASSDTKSFRSVTKNCFIWNSNLSYFADAIARRVIRHSAWKSTSKGINSFTPQIIRTQNSFGFNLLFVIHHGRSCLGGNRVFRLKNLNQKGSTYLLHKPLSPQQIFIWISNLS